MSAKAKGRRSTKNKQYYAAMPAKVAERKHKRTMKRLARKTYWIKQRVKRNGEPVKGIICSQTDS